MRHTYEPHFQTKTNEQQAPDIGQMNKNASGFNFSTVPNLYPYLGK